MFIMVAVTVMAGITIVTIATTAATLKITEIVVFREFFNLNIISK